jgi:hypothetical protein
MRVLERGAEKVWIEPQRNSPDRQEAFTELLHLRHIFTRRRVESRHRRRPCIGAVHAFSGNHMGIVGGIFPAEIKGLVAVVARCTADGVVLHHLDIEGRITPFVAIYGQCRFLGHRQRKKLVAARQHIRDRRGGNPMVHHAKKADLA